MVEALTSESAFEGLCGRVCGLCDGSLERYLSARPGIPEVLWRAMRYSMDAGGKRLRPIMVSLSCRACGGDIDDASRASLAIEMVHTYSLIHDDLPSMDDDDFRRGRPSSHKVFGEGIAILAGDALLTGAFEVLVEGSVSGSLSSSLVAELSHGSGACGMTGGQVCDLLAQDSGGTLESVDYIHSHKTAMMFSCACRMGALCGCGDASLVDLLGNFGMKLGLAFQIVDDLLDVTSSGAQMGKATQKDVLAGKLTYPSLLGVDNSRRRVDELFDESLSIIEPLGSGGIELIQLARILVNREK